MIKFITISFPYRAIECFRVAIDIQPHDSTYVQLGKVLEEAPAYVLQLQGKRVDSGAPG